MNQTQALNGIIICLGILAVIFIIYLISTYKERRFKRFKKRTSNWKVDDRIIVLRYNTSGWLRDDEKFYKLVGWNINNFVISDLDKMHILSYNDHYRNVTAENRILQNTCAKDMGIDPGFKVNDNETNRLYP